MKRTAAALCACATVLTLGMANARADATALGSSYTTGAKITPGVGISVSTATSGDISDLLDFLTPVLDQIVQPLQSKLTALSGSVTSNLAAGITGSDYVASSPSTPQPPPGDGTPDCTGWAAGSCYGPVAPDVDAAPLIGVTAGTLQGYATADGTGAYAGATASDAQLTVLGIPIGTLGTSTTTATCTAAKVCSGSGSIAGTDLLDGAIQLRAQQGETLQASIAGSDFADVSTYTTPTDVTGSNGTTAQVRAAGGGLQVAIPLTLDQLMGGLGVSGDLADLNAYDDGSTVTLTLYFSSGTSSDGSPTKAWGLDVGIGLSADISISVFGLASLQVSGQDASVTGDLADMKFAYTAAANPDGSNPGGAPPALT